MTKNLTERYEEEILSGDADDGTMPDSVARLRDGVVGHRIVKAERTASGSLGLTLDDGRVVTLADTDDCCAYTELDSFLLHPELIDHMITGVGTTNGYTTWHVYADMGDVLEMTVNWSAGNPFYYCYGFRIAVQ
jgi:hypothetical protein